MTRTASPPFCIYRFTFTTANWLFSSETNCAPILLYTDLVSRLLIGYLVYVLRFRSRPLVGSRLVIAMFPIMHFTSGSLSRPLIEPFPGLVTRPEVIARRVSARACRVDGCLLLDRISSGRVRVRERARVSRKAKQIQQAIIG